MTTMIIADPSSDSLTEQLLGELCAATPPCLSLYQPTHRRHPENAQDPIRFRNHVKALEATLRERYPDIDAAPLLEPFETLARDPAFWNHTLDGLAVLVGLGTFRALRLPQSVAEVVVVGESFHTRPLRRFLQTVDRYQVLTLSLDEIRLFEGTRHVLDEVELVTEVPRTISDALGGELTDPHQTVASYGGVGAGTSRMHHGHGGKKDDVDIDADRFFRAIDRAVLEHYSRPSGLPLLLAALPEHHQRFRRVSENPFLHADGILIAPDAVSIEELRVLAWKVLEPHYQERLAALGEEFEKAQGVGSGSDDLEQVARAASSGRVATLLIESERHIAGQLDASTGHIELASANDNHVEDLLDDLGELVTKMGGRVLVIPADAMTTRTGLAATYRY